jgi:hypothetical protein
MGAGVAIGTAPCWGHNYFFARDPVFLSAHSGVNFWIGNNPEANGYPRFPPGLRAGQSAMLEDSISVAETAAGRSLKRSEVSAFWSNKSREYIRQYPARWIELLAIKVRNFWNAFQYDDLSIVTALRERAVIFPGLYFGVVASLGMPGAFLFIWKRNKAARWIIVAVLLHLCALLPVFVTERYRMAAVPGLLVLAAAGLWTWHQALRFGPRSVIISYLALLGLSITLVAWPLRNPSLWALDAYNSGWQALETGNLALAEKNLLRARAYVSGNAETNFALGNLRLAQERWNDAAAFYRETLSIDPHHKGALNNLGVLAFDAHDFTHAREFFRAALAQNPRDAKTHFLLARTAFALGDRAAAEAELAEALRISPEQAEFIGFRTDVLKEPAP